MKTLAPNSTTTSVKVVGGEVALDGSNPTVVATGLSVIEGVSLTFKGSTALGVTATTLSYTTSGGTLNIYAWKPTATGDCTLIAATDTDTVGYTVVGY